MALFSIKNSRGRSVIMPNFSGDLFKSIFNSNRNILVIQCENTTSENRREVIKKTLNVLDDWNGFPETFSLSRVLELSR